MQDNFNLKGYLRNNKLTNENAKPVDEAKARSLEDKVADLYAYTSIDPNYDYDEEDVRKFGQDTVDKALEMAPKILAYKKKLQQLGREIKNSEEGRMLLAVISHQKGYGGSRDTSSSIGDLFSGI